MSGFPGSPRIVKGGIVVVDPATSAVQRVITLQYNPDTLSRSLQPRAFAADSGDRSEALRLKGPPVETIKIDAEIDATDDLEKPDAHKDTLELGILPQLSALETLISPTSAQLLANNALSASGSMEIVPMEAPLTLFVWSRHRVLPVRITDCSITEEAFDINLNPIRAKVSLGMRVLTVDDLGFAHKGGSLFMNYLQVKENAAGRSAGLINTLGIGGIP
jgi:hypothetical protein